MADSSPSSRAAPSGRRLPVLAVSLLGIGCVGIFDCLTGPNFGLSPFYVLLVSLAAWRGGQTGAVVTPVLAAAVWLAADLVTDHQLHPLAACWNGLVRLIVFSVVSYWLNHLRERTALLQKRVVEKSAALDAAFDSRFRTRKALHDSEEQFRSLVEGLKDCAIFMLDAAGNIESWNRGAEGLTGYTAEQVLGRPFSCLWPPEHVARGLDRDAIVRALREGSLSNEGWRVCSDGSRFWAATSLNALWDTEGCITGFSKVIRDVSRQKKLEDQLLAEEENDRRRIGQELHDILGQDLTALALLSSELHESLQSEALPYATAADRISRCASQAVARARHLAHGLCPMKVETGDLPWALEEFALGITDLFGIRCEFRCPEPVHLTNPTFGLHLYRIAQEATTNAVKHGRATQVLLTLSADDGGCTLRIEDDGVGLPDCVGDRSGVGISIMKHRAQAMGGYLILERLGRSGTAVVCSVPLGLQGQSYREPRRDQT